MLNAYGLIRRRWRLWLSLAVLLLGATLLLPAIHWRVLGWIRGEALYEGRPTSWWVRDIEEYYIPIVEGVVFVRGFGNPGSVSRGPVGWSREAPPPWWEWRPEWVAPAATVKVINVTDAPLINGERDALSVLLELVQRPEVKVRQVAVTGLGSLSLQEPAALAALRQAALDPEPAVRCQAEETLYKLAHQ
jgi:hypothetical protein